VPVPQGRWDSGYSDAVTPGGGVAPSGRQAGIHGGQPPAHLRASLRFKPSVAFEPSRERDSVGSARTGALRQGLVAQWHQRAYWRSPLPSRH